jgi:hypothetical protein
MGVGRCRPAGLVQPILNWCIACSRQLSVQFPNCGSQPVGSAADGSDVATWRRGHGIECCLFFEGDEEIPTRFKALLKKSLLSLSQAWTKCNEYVRGIRTEPESAVDSERNAVQECGALRFPRTRDNRSHQLAAICMVTIARTTPAVNVIIATHRIGRSAYMAASPCRARCSSGTLLQLRSSVTQPVTSTASGRVMSRAQSVHILPAYHITIR